MRGDYGIDWYVSGLAGTWYLVFFVWLSGEGSHVPRVFFCYQNERFKHFTANTSTAAVRQTETGTQKIQYLVPGSSYSCITRRDDARKCGYIFPIKTEVCNLMLCLNEHNRPWYEIVVYCRTFLGNIVDDRIVLAPPPSFSYVISV